MPTASAIVTARMDPIKKQRANLIIKKSGTTPSACINKFYDRIIENGELPFDNSEETVKFSKQRIHEVFEWVNELPTFELSDDFKNLSIKEARAMRLSEEVQK